MSKDKDKDKEKKHEQQAAAEAAEAENAKVNETAEGAEQAESAAAADEEKAAEDAASTDAKIAEAAVADMKQRYMRLQADFANFKKRTAGEKLQISEVVKMEVLQNVLPVVDNFERALQVPQDKLTDDLKSFVDGYEMIYKQLMTVLEKEGVVKIDAVGKPFDPNYHQAVMRVASDEYDNDVVVEVLQEGYLLGDKTLRPAMVKVAFNG